MSVETLGTTEENEKADSSNSRTLPRAEHVTCTRLQVQNDPQSKGNYMPDAH